MVDLNRTFFHYFRELSEKQLSMVEKICRVYECNNGDMVYLQGEFCQNWIIVNSGSFLSRSKTDENIEEKILLEGESFNFMSILRNSVTTESLEAVGKSSILVVDILGLKDLAKKKPEIVSLIKLQLESDEALAWEETLFKSSKTGQKRVVKVRRGFLWSLIKALPIALFSGVLTAILLVKFPGNRLIIGGYISLQLLIYTVHYIYYCFTIIVLSSDTISRKEFSFKGLVMKTSSMPLEKIDRTKIDYVTRLYKILQLGTLTIESGTEKISLDGVFRPEIFVEKINKSRENIVDVDKAIELSSFKYLYCKKNGLFCLENHFENRDAAMFTFRKSIIYFLVRALPPFILFLFSSIILYYLLRSLMVFLINIPSFCVILWFFTDWINDRYAFEGNKVIDIEKKPLFGKEKRIEAEISSVLSIKKVQKNIIQVIFNYGDIEISTMGGNIIYPSINNPDKVIDSLYLVKKYYYSKEESKKKIDRQDEFINYTKYSQELNRQ